jgi:hypothetical protein
MNAAGSAAEPRVHRPGGLLWHRDFRLLWFGETVSQVGTAMAVVAMPLAAVTVLQAGAFAVTALVAMTWLPWLLIGLPAGAWVDRLPAGLRGTLWIMFGIVAASGPVLLTHAIRRHRDLPAGEGCARE